MNLDTNITGKLSTKSVKVDENKCACCRRILKSSCEWIHGEKYIICEFCFRSILYPEINYYNQENI
jgi:hypothetical protein